LYSTAVGSLVTMAIPDVQFIQQMIAMSMVQRRGVLRDTVGLDG